MWYHPGSIRNGRGSEKIRGPGATRARGVSDAAKDGRMEKDIADGSRLRTRRGEVGPYLLRGRRRCRGREGRDFLLEPRYAVRRRVCAQCVGFWVSDASGTAGDARVEKTRNATQAAERILAGVFSGTATGSAGAVETQTHHRRRQLRWKRPRDWACAPRGGRARSQRARKRSKQPRRCSGSRLCLQEKPGDKTTSARPSYVARASSKRAERRGCSNRDPVRRPWPQDAPKTASWRCREPAIRRVSRLNNSFAAKELQSVRPLGADASRPKKNAMARSDRRGKG